VRRSVLDTNAPRRRDPHRRLKRWLAGFSFAAALLLVGPAWGNTTVGDAVSGDGTSVGGTNISELKEQIKRDRLSCSGAEGGASALLAVGGLGLLALRTRRRAD